MNDTSRRMVADNDTLDFRLGSREPYGNTLNAVNAESAYLSESRDVSDDLRTIIIEMMDVGRRIRDIEKF